jgi:hypothetical protein
MVEEHLANEEHLLAGVTDAERKRLVRLLRRLRESVRALKGRQAATTAAVSWVRRGAEYGSFAEL